VLNSNANVTEANGVIHRRIRNFAIPTVAAAGKTRGISVAKMQWQVCTQSPVTPMTILKRTTLYLVFAQKEYCLISLVILMYGLLQSR
jgi:hypothetical protein